MPTRKKEPASDEPQEPEAGQSQNPQPSAKLERLQQELNDEYLRCLQAVEQGRNAQQRRYADAYSELVTAVQNLRQEVMDRYRHVFRHDRAGRLVDAHEFEHLAFPVDRSSPASRILAREYPLSR